MVQLHDPDERQLARIGYKQELRREFTQWSTLSYAISVLGVLGSQPATYGVPIAVGGPSTSIYAWAIGSIMAYIIATSVAELVSAYPTAGGMYFVTKHVVPDRHVALWAWIIGWCNLLGQAAGVASIGYTIGQMILAAASMNSGLLGDSYIYSPKPWHTVLVAVGSLAVFAMNCSFTTKKLHQTILWFAPFNILATIGICIALLVLTSQKQGLAAHSFVWADVRDQSGWGSTAFSFMLGFLNVAWVMTDYDGTTHMSEETHDAAVRGPQSIRYAIIVSGLLGLLLNITFTYCLTENYMEDIVGSPTGLPVAQIFLNAGGRAGGTFMLFCVILVQFMTGVSAMLANARMVYAFARDEALPFSHLWSRVNEITGTPVNAVGFVFVFCACLNLIGIGSTQTITAIFNLCAPCLDLSYIAVIFARLVYTTGTSPEVNFVPGPEKIPYGLGRIANIIAILWVLAISVVLFFPPARPVTATNMNYAIVVAGIVALVSVGWYWLPKYGARGKYTGPRTQDDLLDHLPAQQRDPPAYEASSSTDHHRSDVRRPTNVDDLEFVRQMGSSGSDEENLKPKK
ncbi:hypothetical protein DOTSEDRAFT_134384 [Dothistroma septosporum NZE10]|uniref:Amino acid permease-like protein n=1 Tax=Dothistroma septosporum (strain NZE10 / CBS 128990) TaxID=675120 RepID=N1PLA1_DOTSN|nr:hypothetical protein DOTSEDRAFT_134384 [Dothistroma septosporum NZE10]